MLTIAVSVLLSIFSTAVMSYISMAIPIGPWIAPTIVLFSIVIFKLFSRFLKNYSMEIALSTAAGSVGGILATAVGFYFTTLYFLDVRLFESWMSNFWYFVFVLFGLSLTAGLFGMWIANLFEYKFIVQDKLSFPIGELIHKTISAQKTLRKSIELIIGFCVTALFCLFQDGLGKIKGFIPKAYTLVAPYTMYIFKIPLIRLDFWPMLWALGFVTGHVVALPLSIGVLSKILLVRPLYGLGFQGMPWMEFIITYCSGMILSTALFGFIKTPKSLFKAVKNIFRSSVGQKVEKDKFFKRINILETVILAASLIIFLIYFKFSILSQIYLIIFSFICSYQLAIIAGKLGLAPMGKFATFVMVPAMFIFPLGNIQMVFIATFVGISSGVACDILFGRKLALLAGISSSKIKMYQYLGLIVSSLTVGIVFWFLINHFGLGSDQLFALRAQNRWLLINTLNNAKSFNFYVLFLGFIFGFVLSKLRISPLLVLGGLFMPVNVTLGLVIGGVVAFFVKNREEWYPFWSGVYASNSIWMLIKAIF